MELTALRKDETSIPVEVSLSPIALEDEMLIACAIRDISGRKELEEKFRERERLAGVGTMAAIFAHEVASPLDGISTIVQLIAMKLSTQFDELRIGQKLIDLLQLFVEFIKRSIDKAVPKTHLLRYGSAHDSLTPYAYSDPRNL